MNPRLAVVRFRRLRAAIAQRCSAFGTAHCRRAPAGRGALGTDADARPLPEVDAAQRRPAVKPVTDAYPLTVPAPR